MAWIWNIGGIGIIVGVIFLGSAFTAWWVKKDDLSYKDWCIIIAFWFVVCVILKVIGLGN